MTAWTVEALTGYAYYGTIVFADDRKHAFALGYRELRRTQNYRGRYSELDIRPADDLNLLLRKVS
jgi:hypothetical protein